MEKKWKVAIIILLILFYILSHHIRCSRGEERVLNIDSAELVEIMKLGLMGRYQVMDEELAEEIAQKLLVAMREQDQRTWLPDLLGGGGIGLAIVTLIPGFQDDVFYWVGVVMSIAGSSLNVWQRSQKTPFHYIVVVDIGENVEVLKGEEVEEIKETLSWFAGFKESTVGRDQLLRYLLYLHWMGKHRMLQVAVALMKQEQQQ